MEIPHTGHLWQVDWGGFGTQAVWQPFRPWTIEHKRACKHFFILWICFKNVLVLLTYPHHISNDWESNVLRSTDAAHDWNILIKTAAKSNIKRISQLPKYFFWPLFPRPHRFWTTKKLLVAQRGTFGSSEPYSPRQPTFASVWMRRPTWSSGVWL